MPPGVASLLTSDSFSPGTEKEELAASRSEVVAPHDLVELFCGSRTRRARGRPPAPPPAPAAAVEVENEGGRRILEMGLELLVLLVANCLFYFMGFTFLE